MRDSGGSQSRLDLGLPAPPGDRRVGRGLAGCLDDMAGAARAALATTFSSWAGTAGLTSTTALMPVIASSMLAGTSRSPAAICAPASASACAFAFAGSRTSTRTGTSCSRSSLTVSAPTFPAVVTRIMMSLSTIQNELCDPLL